MKHQRLTISDIEEQIANVEFQSHDYKLVICILKCKNGARVIGEAYCTFTEDFNLEKGKVVSRQKAVAKLWELEAYALQSRIYAEVRKSDG
jgi:hypothetical protein